MIKILVFDQQNDLSIDIESAKQVIRRVLELEKSQANEVSLYFVSTKEICRLHEEFFHDPSPTDCISFPIDRNRKLGYQFLGEIFVCPKTALDFVQTYEDINENPYVETTLYVVHSVLHLLGFDDIEEVDRKKMRAKEGVIMQHLLKANILLKAVVSQL
ncbi:MAG: rRNA maturation RNase YbeY [Chlamydiales bacterium]